MPRGNADNFKPLTTEEARRRGRNGGLASVKARRDKRTLRETLKQLLQEPADETGKSGMALMATALFEKAIAGDIKAICEIRDTIGEKPTDKLISDSGHNFTFRWADEEESGIARVLKEARERVERMRNISSEPELEPEKQSVFEKKVDPLPVKEDKDSFDLGYKGELHVSDIQRLQERIKKLKV